MRKMEQSIVLAGGCGFIGANLVKALLKKGYYIHILIKNDTNLWRISDVVKKLQIHKIDILDQKNLNHIMKKIQPSQIINLATYTKYRNQQDFEKMVEVNIKGVMNLLQATKEIPYSIFVNTGSSSEYGNKDKPMREIDPLNPISFYAATKVSSTYLCQVFAREFNKPIVTLRPFSVYGPYEIDDRFIPTIIKSLLKNKIIKITSGKQRRDFIYIDDIVSAYINTLKRGASLKGEVINIGTGKEYTNDEVIEILFKISNKRIPIKKGAFPLRIWDSEHWVADISKAKKLLKWQPEVSLEKGLTKTYQWFIENKYLYEKR